MRTGSPRSSCPPWLGLVLLTTVLDLRCCKCYTTTFNGAAPLYVALVRVSELAEYTADTSVAQSAAAAWRAAGYPTARFMSKAVLPRATDHPQAPPAPVTSIAAAVPVGPGGPTLEPLIAGYDKSRRRLQQKFSDNGPQAGFNGVPAAAPAGTSALAVGPQHILQALGPVLTITTISSAGDSMPGSSRSVALSAVMAGAAADCEDVFDPSAVFDQTAGRYLLSATCGGQGRVLLAASATSDPSSNWFVFGLVADGVGSSLACSSPAQESAVVDYTQVTYNRDGVFITYKSICPSNSTNGGISILALPKYAVYKGMPNFQYPIYTAGELQQALASAGNTSSSSSMSRCSQMAAVVPQSLGDVPTDVAYFVCKDVSRHSCAGQSVIVAALLDTGMLWQYGGPGSRTSTPLLTAQQIQLGDWTSPVTGASLQQPVGGPALQLGPQLRDFWSGGAVLSSGKLYLATSTAVLDLATPAYSRRPSIAWAELSVSSEVTGADSCPQSQAGARARDAFDWLTDYSWNWGAEFDLNYTQHVNKTFAPRIKTAANEVRAAGLPLVGAALGVLGAGAKALYGGEPCTCYRCYWGGAYYRYGGYTGGALAGYGYGYASSGYYFAPGLMTPCQTTCTRCWYYGYPGHGFGNVGDDLTDPIPGPGFRIRSVQGHLTPDAGSGLNQSALAGPTLNIRTMPGVDFTTLFTPCNRSGSLAVSVLQQGLLTQGGDNPLGLLYPAVAVGQGGQVLLVFTYAGPRNTVDGSPAYPGVGSAVIPASGAASTVQVVKQGRGSILPAVSPGASAFVGDAAQPTGGWAELSATAVHAASGTVFAAAYYALGGDNQLSPVGTWISSWQL